MLTEDRRWDAKDRVSVINFLRKLKNSCDALGVAEGAAVYLLQWLVSETVMVVIRRVVPMGIDTAAVAAQPKFKHIIRELLEEYLDEDVLSDRLRELQYAKQHAWETEGKFCDRIVALNAALGALLDGKELKAVLVQGVGESLRAAARQYNTAGRSFTNGSTVRWRRDGWWWRRRWRWRSAAPPLASAARPHGIFRVLANFVLFFFFTLVGLSHTLVVYSFQQLFACAQFSGVALSEAVRRARRLDHTLPRQRIARSPAAGLVRLSVGQRRRPARRRAGQRRLAHAAAPSRPPRGGGPRWRRRVHLCRGRGTPKPDRRPRRPRVEWRSPCRRARADARRCARRSRCARRRGGACPSLLRHAPAVHPLPAPSFATVPAAAPPLARAHGRRGRRAPPPRTAPPR